MDNVDYAVFKPLLS